MKVILGQAREGANPKRALNNSRERHEWRRANLMLGALEILDQLVHNSTEDGEGWRRVLRLQS